MLLFFQLFDLFCFTSGGDLSWGMNKLSANHDRNRVTDNWWTIHAPWHNTIISTFAVLALVMGSGTPNCWYTKAVGKLISWWVIITQWLTRRDMIKCWPGCWPNLTDWMKFWAILQECLLVNQPAFPDCLGAHYLYWIGVHLSHLCGHHFLLDLLDLIQNQCCSNIVNPKGLKFYKFYRFLTKQATSFVSHFDETLTVYLTMKSI